MSDRTRAWQRTGRAGRVLAGTAVVLLLPTSAVAGPAPAGHSGVDGQASRRAPSEGPVNPGLAWRTDLGFEFAGRVHEDPFPVDGDGTVYVSGRIINDDDLGNEGYLNAVDGDTGEVLWDAPFVGIESDCNPAVTDDGRVIVQLEAGGEAHAGNDNLIVALDAATGERIAGQQYTTGDSDMRPCPSRLVLAGDLVLMPYGGSDAGFRAIDTSSWTQAFNFKPKNEQDGFVGNGRNDQVVVNAAGDTAYYLSVKDNEASPRTWWLNAIRLSNGTIRDRIELPGQSSAAHLKRIVAVDGGVVLALAGCDGQPINNETGCVVGVDDDGSDLSLDWTTRPAEPDGGRRVTLASLTDTGTGVVVGWTLGGSGVYGLSVATGDVVFRHRPSSFSNNGFQMIADSDGTVIHGAFGGNYLEALDAAGRSAWAVPDCAPSTATQRFGEPSTVGGITPGGTLVTGNTVGIFDGSTRTGGTYVLLGLRDGSNAASGDCPATDERVAGLNRVETAIEVSQTSFPQQDSADTVVIAVSTNYPDALSGGPLARKVDAPLLLTEREALNPSTRAEILRLGARTAILLGGTAALSNAVETELGQMGLTTDRIAGADRFDTARMVASRVPATTVYVTEGSNADPARGWPDAVAVSGLAAFEQRPILLVSRDEAPAPTLQALRELGATDVVVVGGEAAVSAATAAALADHTPGGGVDADVTREAGASRFETSVKVAERSIRAGASTTDLWFATGLTFPDALTAGPAVARSGGVLVLVHGQDPAGGPETYTFLEGLDDGDIHEIWLVGGPAAIADPVAQRIASTLGAG